MGRDLPGVFVLLPDTGTYTVLIDPYEATTGEGRVQLYEVNDLSGSVTVNGGGLPISLPNPGQKASLTFVATGGQAVTARMSGNTIGAVTVKLLKPDGSQVTSNLSSSSSFTLTQHTPAASGTYTIVVDPYGAATGNITVAVTNP